MITIFAAALSLLLLGSPVQESNPAPPAAGPRIQLPDGPAARAWAAVGPETLPAAVELEGLPAHPRDALWGSPDTWDRWARALKAEAEAEWPDPSRRAELALLAWGQGRSDDAWGHLACTGGEPGICAALLPALLPGLPPEHRGRDRIGPGGVPRALPDGVLLRPALPPSSGLPHPGRLERRNMRLDGLRIGEAVLALDVRVEYEGVQIDVHHLEGGAASFLLVLPEPPSFETRVEYVDWFRQDTVGLPHRVEMGPGEEYPRTLFGRVLPRETRWPRRLPDRLPCSLELDGLRLLVPADDRHRRALGGLAAALERVLEVPCELVAEDPAGIPAPFSGIAIRLPQDATRPLRLRHVLSGCEAWALR